MSPQPVSLKWSNHYKNLVQSFGRQFEREQYVDVTISCQGRFIKAHRIVLGACSPYFQELFVAHESTPHPIIIMNGHDFDDIRSIVEFVYTGQVMVTAMGMQRFLAIAEDLQIKGLCNLRFNNDARSEGGRFRAGQKRKAGGSGRDEIEPENAVESLQRRVSSPVVKIKKPGRRKQEKTGSYDNERELGPINTRGVQYVTPHPPEDNNQDVHKDKGGDLSSESMMSSVDQDDEQAGRKQASDCVEDVVVLRPSFSPTGDHMKETIPTPPNEVIYNVRDHVEKYYGRV